MKIYCWRHFRRWTRPVNRCRLLARGRAEVFPDLVKVVAREAAREAAL
jgi:hypothetical protein